MHPDNLIRVKPYEDPNDFQDDTLEQITPFLIEIAREGYNDVPSILRQYRGMDADEIADEHERRIEQFKMNRLAKVTARFGWIGSVTKWSSTGIASTRNDTHATGSDAAIDVQRFSGCGSTATGGWNDELDESTCQGKGRRTNAENGKVARSHDEKATSEKGSGGTKAGGAGLRNKQQVVYIYIHIYIRGETNYIAPDT